MKRMRIIISLWIGYVVIGLCSGFPIEWENSAADYHTQFLTGLVGVLLTVCGVIFLVGCLCCQRRDGFKEFYNSPAVASLGPTLDHGHINPIANGEFTILSPLSSRHHNNNIFLANENIVGQTEIDYSHADVHSWFDGSERDFPRTKLKYIKELGKGWFGRVVEGTAQGFNDTNDEQPWTRVAVRILEASATSRERAVFLHDAMIYRTGHHPHILQLLGRSLESVPLLLLQELCPQGDLKKYLRDNRKIAFKLFSSDSPLLWCCQLLSALKHLHEHRLTHPDLATRNCQIVSDSIIKLGDYGLAASLYPEDYYQGAPAVPVRWCSPESLTYTSTTIQPKQTTYESNIWSLGVTLWEIYSCGDQPYADLNDDDVISKVLGSPNVRLPKPNVSVMYIDYMFSFMQMCWTHSEIRPSASKLYLMMTDLMHIYQKTKHTSDTSSPHKSAFSFDNYWNNLKPNSVMEADNLDNISATLVDLNLSSNAEQDLLNLKPMSPSLNNLHGSLDNLANTDMESWLQKVATKTGDMSYVRGLSEAIKDLDNALASENVSSSGSSHQPSPAPETLSNIKNKLEFKLGPSDAFYTDFLNVQNGSLIESMQRTSSGSETEDENWRRKIEMGAYSEKVHQKSKSVTDLMILTHIECSESDSETPMPSLDYRVNYKNVRYAPKQNLENASLMFGSEGNLLSVHDKFQEELKKLQEERKDSLFFVPESVSHSKEKCSEICNDKEPLRGFDNSSSEDESRTIIENEDITCTFVNTNSSPNITQTISPSHLHSETLIEELSSPTDIQPGNQVYNIFNVTVDSSFSPINMRFDVKDLICYKDLETPPKSLEKLYQVPTLIDIIQNNDKLIDYIITHYDTQDENLNNLDEAEEKSESSKVDFDVSLGQDEVTPNSMTHSAVFSSTPFKKPVLLDANKQEGLQFSSNFSSDLNEELKYSLETWDNFLGKAMDEPRECKEFDEFSSEPQSLLFVVKDLEDEATTNECKNEVLLKNLDLQCDYNLKVDQETITDADFQDNTDSDDSVAKHLESCTLNEMFTKETNSQIEGIEESINNATFTSNDNQKLNKTYSEGSQDGGDKWEPGGGWFLHPQTDTEVSGDIDVSQGECNVEESYVGFNMDDEIVAAIRNELLMKLPQAQGRSSEPDKDFCDWDNEERSEVLIKYNVYATPLSPIPEESYSENDSYRVICNRGNSSDSENDDWPDPYEEPNSDLLDTESQSVQNMENPILEPFHRHTPSEDSCCSNDTLFSLDDFTYGMMENENIKYNRDLTEHKDELLEECNLKIENCANEDSCCLKKDMLICNLEPEINDAKRLIHVTFNSDDIISILEHNNDIEIEKNKINIENGLLEYKCDGEVDSEEVVLNIEEQNKYGSRNIDRIDKTEERLLDNDKITSLNFIKNEILTENMNKDIKLSVCENNLNISNINENEVPAAEENGESVSNLFQKNVNSIDETGVQQDCNIEETKCIENSGYNNVDELVNRTYTKEQKLDSIENYIDIQKTEHDLQIQNENNVTTKMHYITEFLNHERQGNLDSSNDDESIYASCFTPENRYVNIDDINMTLIEDLQLSDSVDYVDGVNIQPEYINIIQPDEAEEHLYDPVAEDCLDINLYGALTDIRFSGPGDIQLMSTSFSESADLDEQDWDSGSDTRSSSSGEFIWKEGEHEESVKALRAAPQDSDRDKPTDIENAQEISSESSDEDEEDADSPEFVPSAWDKYATPTKSALRSPEKTLEKAEVKHKKSKGVWFKKQKYHCVYEYPREPESPSINSFELWQPVPAPMIGIALDGEFYISSTTRPFESFETNSSQFFPGQMRADHWMDTQTSENITPDSGMEDITPSSNSECDLFVNLPTTLNQDQVQPLKILAAAASLKQKNNAWKQDGKDSLGRLRHARNKLKLDLPPSPNAFTSTKVFTIDPPEEPITKREIPTFTSFGKSRFFVQHVDTPTPDEETVCKNVSFEALPYKPLQTKEDKGKVEIVRGEASLLDSADEDSGIESSTLERKKIISLK